jgi:RHS repeat-associated protein
MQLTGVTEVVICYVDDPCSCRCTWDKTLVDFTVQMGNSGADDGTAYDANGNILKMKQWGLKLTGSTQIDNLTYTYWNPGNMLKAVTESGTGTTDHKLGDFTDKNNTVTDYGYDRNGNLAIDLNKRINGTVAPNTGLTSGTGITYNHLNLPTLITVRNDANTADKGTITYIYDANGVKLKKITTESSASVTLGGSLYTTDISTTTYLNGAIFESKQYSNTSLNPAWGYTDKLLFFSQEEGRVEAVYGTSGMALEYDYMLKDHLGNVRMILTEESRKDAYPVASMETAFAGLENVFYSNLDATRVNRPSGYTDTYTNPNDKVALVRGDGNKIGPAILLKVMAGDKFNVRASAWWTGTSSGSNTSPLTSIVSALIGGLPGQSVGKIGATDLTAAILDPQVTAFLTNDQPSVSGKPKAYLNWILFDEQLKYIGNGNSGAESVETSGVVKQFNKVNLPVNQNGYMYIYTSNETSYDVFFDNLQVTQIYGPLLEETHYYPWGLTMAGISSKALKGTPENKYKYNGIEKESDLGLEVYDAQLRELDGQTGRWWQIDPKTEDMEMWSPYVSNYNNPIRYSDPLGDEGQDCCWFTFDKEAFMDGIKWFNTHLNPLTPVVEFVTGKSMSSDLKEDKPRLVTLQESMAPVPAKVKGAGTLSKAEQLSLNAEKGTLSEKRVLAEEGLKKNTTPVTVTDPKTGKPATTIPDAVKSSGATVEVKDVKKLSDSKQLRAQSEASAQNGQKATVITGTNTKVSPTVENRMKVQRKDNLGPQN